MSDYPDMDGRADERSEREAFEAWARSILGYSPRIKHSSFCQFAWQAWQARASAPTPEPMSAPTAEPVAWTLTETLTRGKTTTTGYLWFTDPQNSGWTALYAAPPSAATPEPSDAERYQLVRRGQHWSVIDGIGNVLRGDDLDTAVDAIRATKGGKL